MDVTTGSNIDFNNNESMEKIKKRILNKFQESLKVVENSNTKGKEKSKGKVSQKVKKVDAEEENKPKKLKMKRSTIKLSIPKK